MPLSAYTAGDLDLSTAEGAYYGGMEMRDYSGRVIDRADWLDIRQRTEDEIGAARRDYDRLAGSATVMGDIAPSERVRDAWDSWSTGRRRW